MSISHSESALVLATIAVARLQLPGRDEDDILNLVEEGDLPFAWNIALRVAKAREIRIWPDCIQHYASSGGRIPYPISNPAEILSVIFAWIDGNPFIPSTAIRLLLNCSGTHVTNLVDAKVLVQAPDTKYRRGLNGSARVTPASLKKFFETRMQGAC